MTTTPTPKFAQPPVVETVLGVQFAPLDRFGVPHLGLFWASIRGEYPRQEVQPALDQEMDAPPRPRATRLTVTNQPEVRCWFLDSDGGQLIQVQRDRFIRNWRRVPGNDAYPSYDVLKPRFERDWAQFHDFLAREELGRPDVNLCEATYVNHLAEGEGWSSFGHIHDVLSIIAPPERHFLPEPEIATLNMRYLMPDKLGRLHVTLQPAVRQGDAKPVLQLTLIARGRPASSRTEDLLAWFDIGHEWIVRGFAEVTTEAMHRLWGRYR